MSTGRPPTAVSESPLSGDSTAAGPARYDVLRYPDETHRVVPAGDGRRVVTAHEREARKRRAIASVTIAVVTAVVVAVGLRLTAGGIAVPVGGGLVIGLGVGVLRRRLWSHDGLVPVLAVADVQPRTVREYVEDFDPDAVTDPFT